MTEFEPTGEEPVNPTPDNTEKKRRATRSDKGKPRVREFPETANKAEKSRLKGAKAAAKSTARIIEDAKRAAEAEAKTPNIMGGAPAVPADEPAMDPFDPARLRIDPRNDAGKVQREIINISVRKPSKYEPFRTHPTLRISVTLCMPKKGAHEGEIFLVAPEMKALLVQHTVSATLYFLMTAEGAPLVAPVPFPEEGGKEHGAHSSFRIIAARAEKEWCLAIYKKSTSAYELGTQPSDFGEPVWPDLSLREILEKAFRDCHIKDRNHPFVKSVGLGPRA